MRLYVWVLIHIGLIYWGKALWFPKTSTLTRFIPHMPLMRLCLTPVTGSLYRPFLGLLISARISLWSLGLGRERPNIILFVFRSDDDLLDPLPISIFALVRASDSLQRNSGSLGNKDYVWSRSILNRGSRGLQTWKSIGFQLRILRLETLVLGFEWGRGEGGGQKPWKVDGI